MMENSTDFRIQRLRLIYSVLSIYLVRVAVVKLFERLENAYIPSLEAFSTHVIPAPFLHRASSYIATDAQIQGLKLTRE